MFIVVFSGLYGGTGTAAEITSIGTTNTKRTRRKKTLAELREEECFLSKEKGCTSKRRYKLYTLHLRMSEFILAAPAPASLPAVPTLASPIDSFDA
ncbi:hypothetical protein LINPERPRIM_LOCUS15009, partial [Linum perenne]